MAGYLLIPFIHALEAFAVRNVVNQKGADGLFVIEWGNRLELFLAKGIPNVKLCPFIIAIFNRYGLSLYLNVP